MIYVIVIGTLIFAVYAISLCKIASKKQPPVLSTASQKHESYTREVMISASESIQKSCAGSL